MLLVLPFVLMLLCIAVLPLAASRWWERDRNKLLAAGLISLPIVIRQLTSAHGLEQLWETGEDYLSFVILLSTLYVISGGIFVDADLPATPRTNMLFLLAGSVLASVMGTTGASMVLVRPLLSTLKERKHTAHTVVFFIFLVANIGGALTPLGDPPLFMGYLAGVPFLWPLHLFPQWALTIALVLCIYVPLDRYFYRRESAQDVSRDLRETTPLVLHGKENLALLLAVVAIVALVHVAFVRDLLLVGLAALSYLRTDPEWHRRNHFSFHPIIEVAVLFLGIFITMIPALGLLREHGQQLGFASPLQFFWGTGLLSSVLDNTPTYLVFFNLARALGLASEVAGMPAAILTAISLGAVFFGAATYIGNAPNFMIRAIAEEQGIKMPSFFHYSVWSLVVLGPVFVVVSLIWF